jgi:predicted GH43/DUF377 family glycosyl hydrolase
MALHDSIQVSDFERIIVPSRRRFLLGASATALALAGASSIMAEEPGSQQVSDTPATVIKQEDADHIYASREQPELWKSQSFSIDRWWGDFSRDLPDQMDMFASNPWSIGPFNKYSGNPVLSPTAGAWDQGIFSGGVHNGSIIVKEGLFYYIYRGTRPIDVSTTGEVDYICDIGIAVSKDGIHFTKDDVHSPLFRNGEDRKYSFEDVNLVSHEGMYYLFCNQWLWGQQENHGENGTFLATSTDLLHWTKRGIVFPNATRTHRNGVVVQNGDNEAVRISGRFVMYINDGLIAYSNDMLNWESHENPNRWPGGEGCFALADHNPDRPDDIVLFTGGAHTGHWYAVGEALFSKGNPEKPRGWLPRSPLFAEVKYPYENGFTAETPHKPISNFSDCIFFNGLTRHERKWWLYYGGSEYYTCLATAPA